MSIVTPRKTTDRLSRAQHGFSLVELMVAMTVSLILLAGVVQIFTSSKQTYRLQEANSRVQENGRTAIALLQRDIRPAGFQGCRSARGITPSIKATGPIPATINGSTIVRGFEKSAGTWTPNAPAVTALTTMSAAELAKVTDGTDLITIQDTSGCVTTMTASMTNNSSPLEILVPNICNFGTNTGQRNLAVVSDCASADIFRITAVATVDDGNFVNPVITGASFTANTALSQVYNQDSSLMSFDSFSYYIAPGVTSPNRPSLWRYDNTRSVVTAIAAAATTPPTLPNPVELVTDVVNMQVEYGQNTDTSDQVPNFYVPAASITDWTKVIAVRVSLLVQTPADNLSLGNQTYSFNRTNTTAGDKRIYRVFTTTISLRNGA